MERWQQTPFGLVVVLAPVGEVGPARVAVIATDGVARVATIDRVRIGPGRVSREQPELPIVTRGPGLAVDAEHGRAFLVLPDIVAPVVAAALEDVGEPEPVPDFVRCGLKR